ncbi:unnamed protein product [Adineta ricciae]|uniref:Uncharacterized protein n=1 Tax=Adineta ricciae TaxID=249248 RepID=A0A815L8K2_ADIRI|nr:unnamed protein product [Adineta ricciae]
MTQLMANKRQRKRTRLIIYYKQFGEIKPKWKLELVVCDTLAFDLILIIFMIDKAMMCNEEMFNTDMQTRLEIRDFPVDGGRFFFGLKINVEDTSSTNSPIMIVDRQALEYNAKLDKSHLIGICLVVAGGILFTFSLLMPTFCHMWCASGEANDETDPLKLRMEITSSEQSIPVCSVPKSVQPNYRKDESRVTTDGMVPITSP